MWKIFQEEFRKIASRKIVWIGLFVLLAFVRFRIGEIQNDYSVLIDGETFYGKEAIEKDKELTARYAGSLTEEKIREFYEKYGFFYYDADTRERKGNFCSQFMTEHLTNFRQIENEETVPESIVFFEGEEWERNVGSLLDGTIRFDYAYGWENLREVYGIMIVCGLAVLFIIGLSPVFAEEYTLKTADILLTTQRGKKSGIWMKAAAALCFTVSVYCAVTLYVWGDYMDIARIASVGSFCSSSAWALQGSCSWLVLYWQYLPCVKTRFCQLSFPRSCSCFRPCGLMSLGLCGS